MIFFAWYDKRIKAAVSSCGFSQIHSILREGINHNFALFSNGFLKCGDNAELVADLAPTPFLMTNGAEDAILPVEGVNEIADIAGRAYAGKGRSEHFKSIVFEAGHSFPDEIKEQAYRWLDQFLK